MDNFRLEINARNQPTVLERLLQTTRYRGFSVIDLSVKPSLKLDTLNIKLTVKNSSENESSLINGYQKLSSQLAKLFDINQIKLLESKTNKPRLNLKAFN